jgi:hypothetical protein
VLELALERLPDSLPDDEPAPAAASKPEAAGIAPAPTVAADGLPH